MGQIIREIELSERNATLIQTLVAVWEASVRATHRFLSDAEIRQIKTYVPEAMAAVTKLILIEEEQDPIGFMGIEDGTLEMLFLAPEKRGKGLGKRLLQEGMERYGVRQLTVNEQNPEAKGFYEHMGFEVYQRTDKDAQGNPYPILYMRRREKKPSDQVRK